MAVCWKLAEDIAINKKGMEKELSDEKRHQVWRCEIDLMEKVLDVCKKHDLSIWVSGGTLLGAVRHKGFIPWDDDIDMVMMRKDYDKLLAVAESEFKYPYFFQTAYTDKQYIHGHAQLRNSETSAILPVDKRQPFNQGIFVDIFVYDAIPSTKRETQLQHIKVKFIQKFMYWRYYWYTAHNQIVRGCLYLAHIFVKPISHRWMYLRMENIFRRYSNKPHQYVAMNMFSYDNMDKYKCNVDDYKETVWLDFEDIKVPAPKGYDRVLRTQYGDYMTPQRSESMHGSKMEFDVNHSYKEILKTPKGK